VSARRLALVGAATLLAALVAGCVVPDEGFAPGYGAPYDYYEPYGEVYGGWAPGYEVGPFRDHHDHDHDHHFGGAPGGAHHAFTPAPAGRAVPSIPSGARPGGGGGGRSGGGGGRGGGGGSSGRR